MSAVHVTAAQARALGVDAAAVKSRGRPRQRRTAPGPYTSFCFDCGEEFTTRTAETRHLDTTGHCRYVVSVAAAGAPPPAATATGTKAAP